MEDPIIVLGFPRTGHSMITGIFEKHGAWVGNMIKAPQINPTGVFTNGTIRDIQQALFPGGCDEIRDHIPGFRKKIEEAIKNDGYVDGPWVMKNPVAYWKAWDEFKPIWVLVKRELKNVIKSNQEKRVALLTKYTLSDAVKKAYDEMEKIERLPKAYVVHPGKIVKGDYTELEAPMEQAGLQLKKDIIEHFVDKDLWHYGD